MSNNEKTFTLEQVCSLTELSHRTVRYYIQLGLVDRPVGETRAAYYTSRHIEQILAIRKWAQAGVSLERIGEILRAPSEGEMPPMKPRGAGSVEVWSHLVLADGVELIVEPGRAGLSPEKIRSLFREVSTVYERILEKGK